MFTYTQLKAIKKSLKPFFLMYTDLVKYWNGDGERDSYPHITAAMVLLQNLIFDGSNCEGFSDKRENQKVEQIEELIYKMRDYYGKQDYMIAMLADAVETAFFIERNKDEFFLKDSPSLCCQ